MNAIKHKPVTSMTSTLHSPTITYLVDFLHLKMTLSMNVTIFTEQIQLADIFTIYGYNNYFLLCLQAKVKQLEVAYKP